MKEEIRKELHKLIDEIDDEESLNLLKEEATAYASGKDIMDDLTPEQLKELEESIGEADRGEGIPLDDFLKEIESWKKQ
jgi:hypothetical protein